MTYYEPTDEQIADELAALDPARDGDETVEHPDTQFSDYPPKPTVELSIPRSATIDAASYWMKRAAALCPGSDVIPKFV